MIKFKNDKERQAFLENYTDTSKGWYLWHELKDTYRKWWRADMFGTSFIVEEQLITREWPKTHIVWEPMYYYIVQDWSRPFADSRSSKTMCIVEIKRIQKELG